MLRFCPTCHNLLRTDRGPTGMRFACLTCPYINNIKKPVVTRYYFKSTKATIITEQSGSGWEGREQTDERCPQCSHPRAYFLQLQTRSADEPMTIFYKCCNRECNHTWRDG